LPPHRKGHPTPAELSGKRDKQKNCYLFVMETILTNCFCTIAEIVRERESQHCSNL
jgi:hypothetical protein